MPERHTADNIRELMSAVLVKWSLTENKMVAVTTDNGANIDKACRDAGKSTNTQHIHILILQCIILSGLASYKYISLFLRMVTRAMLWSSVGPGCEALHEAAS